MIWIVSGPSCSGKSTFIKSPTASQITGLGHDQQVIFPFQKDFRSLKNVQNAFFHYNILRPVWKVVRRRPIAYMTLLYPNWLFLRLFGTNRSNYSFVHDKWDYKLDSKWMLLAMEDIPKKAIVLVADYHILIRRVLERKERESNSTAFGILKRYYPARRWAFAYGVLDLPLIYEMWYKELRRVGIEFISLDAETYEELHAQDLVQARGSR